MKSLARRAEATSTFILLFAAIAFAQASPGMSPAQPLPNQLNMDQLFRDPTRTGTDVVYNTTGAVLILTVKGEDGKPLDRQAVVKLTNRANKDVSWQATREGAQAAIPALIISPYEVEVSAVGYLTSTKPIMIARTMITYREEITLKKDPTAIELAAPSAARLPLKTRREIDRAVLALKSGNLKEAEKRLDAADKLGTPSADGSFLRGYLLYQRQKYADAEKYLAEAGVLDAKHVQALTLLGRLRLLRNDSDAARAPLEQAVAADPHYWVAQELLAQICLNQRDWAAARDHAEAAIERGKGVAKQAPLTLGQALANLGQWDAAIKALNAYLQDVPSSPVAAQVRDLTAQLERRRTHPEETQPLGIIAGASAVVATDAPVALKNWGPPSIDDAVPPVASGVQCPANKVIAGAGRRVEDLVQDVARFDATESVLHQDLDRLGNPTSSETRTFDYVAAIGEVRPGLLQVDEYRRARSQLSDFPGHIATRGLPGLALVFHPRFRDDFEMQCEGLGQWGGQATWLVHFRQREGRPNRIHAYKVDGNVQAVPLKGRAWISAGSLQMVRMEAELLKPIPEIQLMTEHWTVQYGPVSFPKKKVELWLPKTAELHFDFLGHRYYRRHSFDNFMLFSVDAGEQRKVPKAENKAPGVGGPS